MRLRDENPDGPSFCGFYWHSSRLTRAGTDYIFGDCQQKFQACAKDGLINWNNAREILFMYKRTMDEKYRKMMWHFSQGDECNNCKFWDEMYKNKDKPRLTPIPEISDVEMLDAADEVEAMEVDGAN